MNSSILNFENIKINSSQFFQNSNLIKAISKISSIVLENISIFSCNLQNSNFIYSQSKIFINKLKILNLLLNNYSYLINVKNGMLLEFNNSNFKLITLKVFSSILKFEKIHFSTMNNISFSFSEAMKECFFLKIFEINTFQMNNFLFMKVNFSKSILFSSYFSKKFYVNKLLIFQSEIKIILFFMSIKNIIEIRNMKSDKNNATNLKIVNCWFLIINNTVILNSKSKYLIPGFLIENCKKVQLFSIIFSQNTRGINVNSFIGLCLKLSKIIDVLIENSNFFENNYNFENFLHGGPCFYFHSENSYGNFLIKSTNFTKNKAYFQSNLGIFHGNSIKFINCLFSEQISLNLNPGITGIYFSGNYFESINCSFANNINFDSILYFREIFSKNSFIFLNNCRFINNFGNIGSSIHLKEANDRKFQILKSYFSNNTSVNFGSCILAEFSSYECKFISISVLNSKFIANFALGGVVIDIYIYMPNIFAYFKENQFISNKALIFSVGSVIAIINFKKYTTLYSNNNIFKNNTSLFGGLYIIGYSKIFDIGSEFYNFTSYKGGVFYTYFSSKIFIEKSLFKKNFAYEGSIIFCESLELSLIDVKIIENRAGLNLFAFYQHSNVFFKNVYFCNNTLQVHSLKSCIIFISVKSKFLGSMISFKKVNVGLFIKSKNSNLELENSNFENFYQGFDLNFLIFKMKNVSFFNISNNASIFCILTAKSSILEFSNVIFKNLICLNTISYFLTEKCKVLIKFSSFLNIKTEKTYVFIIFFEKFMIVNSLYKNSKSHFVKLSKFSHLKFINNKILNYKNLKNEEGNLIFGEENNKILLLNSKFEKIQNFASGSIIKLKKSFFKNLILNTTFDTIYSNNLGGSLCFIQSIIIINNCIFINNQAKRGGAIYLYFPYNKFYNFTLNNSKFVNCKALINGGVVYWKFFTLILLINNFFINCSANYAPILSSFPSKYNFSIINRNKKIFFNSFKNKNLYIIRHSDMVNPLLNLMKFSLLDTYSQKIKENIHQSMKVQILNYPSNQSK